MLPQLSQLRKPQLGLIWRPIMQHLNVPTIDRCMSAVMIALPSPSSSKAP